MTDCPAWRDWAREWGWEAAAVAAEVASAVAGSPSAAAMVDWVCRDRSQVYLRAPWRAVQMMDVVKLNRTAGARRLGAVVLSFWFRSIGRQPTWILWARLGALRPVGASVDGKDPTGSCRPLRPRGPSAPAVSPRFKGVLASFRRGSTY